MRTPGWRPRRGWSQAAAGVRWLAGATGAWLLVLVIDAGRNLPALLASAATFANALELAGLLALLGSAPLALPHAIQAWTRRQREGGGHARAGTTARRSRGRAGSTWAWLRERAGSTALVALLVAAPGWDLGVFLTSGDAIAASALQLPLRVGICLGVVGGGAALWCFHLLIVTGRPHWLVSLLGWLALAALVATLATGLRAYTYFARVLLLVAWLLSATLVFRTVGRLGARPLALALGAAALAVALARGLAPDAIAVARNRLMRDSQLVALTEIMVRQRDTSAASLDISLPERFACGPPATPSPPPPLAVPERARRNVILISFDALRADAVGQVRPALVAGAKQAPSPTAERAGAPGPDERSPAGPDRKPPALLMPNLTELSTTTRYYPRAVTTYPATLMAIGGALTGLAASDILLSPRRPENIFARTRDRFDQQLIALPKSAWFALPIIDALFVQGTFMRMHATARSQTAWLLRALRKARRKRERVMAWIHYFEPHAPYEVHPGFDFGKRPEQRYASELAYVDAELGRLLRYLRKGKWLEDTLILVFADHGQALGERDYHGHHVYLNSWITDIPMMVHVPGETPRRHDALAEITDVAPTVLDFAGVPYAPSSMAGQSLLRPRAATGTERLAFAEAFPARGRQLFEITNVPITSLDALAERIDLAQRGAENYLPKVAVASREHRLIVNRVTGATELYDRIRDPHEEEDLSADQPAVLRRLMGALGAWTRAQSERLYCAVKRAQAQAGRPARD